MGGCGQPCGYWEWMKSCSSVGIASVLNFWTIIFSLTSLFRWRPVLFKFCQALQSASWGLFIRPFALFIDSIFSLGKIKKTNAIPPHWMYFLNIALSCIYGSRSINQCEKYWLNFRPLTFQINNPCWGSDTLMGPIGESVWYKCLVSFYSGSPEKQEYHSRLKTSFSW